LTDSLSLPERERPGKLYLIGMAALLVFCQLLIALTQTSFRPIMMTREGAILQSCSNYETTHSHK